MFHINSCKSRANICLLVFVVISVMITGYIFYNSFQKPADSNKRSNAISKKIQAIVDPDKKISEANFKKHTRKAAHVIEFAALGISIGHVFLCIYKKEKKIFVSLPLLLVLFVAVTDEFIQGFNGRTSKVTDVLIDFAGSAGGLLVALMIATVYYRRLKKMTANKK